MTSMPIRTIACVALLLGNLLFALAENESVPRIGDPLRPNLESYRMDNILSQGDVSYTGDLFLSLPLLTVPGKHGHDFQINLNYNSNITQRQTASWVGLGWSLELGSVQRTVLGRIDEKGGPGFLQRWGRIGWVMPGHGIDSVHLQDQADLYSLDLEGETTELLAQEYSSHAARFVPLRYKPSWGIIADFYGSTYENFIVKKEDGTRYIFSPPVLTSAIDDQGAENFSFGHRWPLSKILYPDGDSTTIWYNPGGLTSYRADYYGTVVIDRGIANEDDKHNLYGAGYESWPRCSAGYCDSAIARRNAWPDSLYTATHLAVFIHEQPALVDINALQKDKYERTDRNRRLREIIIYDRATRTELRRARFFYAKNNNTHGFFHVTGEDSAWTDSTRLNNNQLTLVGVQILNAQTDTRMPPYQFRYYQNPKVDWVHLTKKSGDPGYEEFPGYHTEPVFGTAWRLKEMQLPTGAKIKYTYSVLNNDTSYRAYIDPEGRDARDSAVYYAAYWSYKFQPRCRLASKVATDTLGVQRSYTFSYGDVILDPPARPIGMSYLPRIYQGLPFEKDFYIYYGGCTIGHRDVAVTYPDGSWKRVYFTSSYRGAGADRLEGQPDSIAGFPIPADSAVTIRSRSACRGLVWKTETPFETTINKYTFIPKDSICQRIEYFIRVGVPGTMHHRAKEYSYSTRLDTIVTARDSISMTTLLFYESEPEGNGLLAFKIEYVPGLEPRMAAYDYAYSYEPDMRSAGLVSQLYSVEFLGSGEGKKITKWSQISGRWLLSAEFVRDTTSRVMRYEYDSFGNISKTTDANGFVTKYFYGTNSIPFQSQTISGLSQLTGIERPNNMRESVKRDHFGNVTERTNENGNITNYQYDGLGRLTAVYGPGNTLLNTYLHRYEGDAYGPASPNYLRTKVFRSASDSAEIVDYWDGLGQAVQKQVRFGDEDIIAHSSFDNMGRLQTSYKPYKLNVNHSFDCAPDSHAATYYAQLGVEGIGAYPFSSKHYMTDGSGRILHDHPAGTVFQNETNGRYTQYSYSRNRQQEVLHVDGESLFKTKVVDENNSTISTTFADWWGNTVCSVVDSGGLSLTTLMEYDVQNKLRRVAMPNHAGFRVPATEGVQLDVSAPSNKDSVQFTFTPALGRKVKVTLAAGSGLDGSGAGGEPPPFFRPQHGITIWFTIQQFSSGVLQPMDPHLVYFCYHNPDFSFPGSISYDIFPNVDEVKIFVDSVWYFDGVTEGVAQFDLSGAAYQYDRSYTYDYRGRLVSQFTPDNGVTRYRHDENGNLRFVQDADQMLGGRLTYTKYDSLNRLVEVGECTGEFEEIAVGTSGTPANDAPVSSDSLFRTRNFYDAAVGSGSGGRNLLSRLVCTVASNDGVRDSTFYSYDDFGRVEWQLQKLAGLAPKKLTYAYDRQGNLTKSGYLDLGNANNNTWFFYEYDQLGRLSGVFSGLDSAGSARIHEGAYTYHANSQVQRLQLGIAQGIDYRYNERDWLTHINTTMHDPSADAGNDGINGIPIDQFGQRIGYHLLAAIGSGQGFTATPQYNGNISWTTMRTNQIGLPGVDAGYPDPITGMVFNYDNANRLLKADFGYYNEYGLLEGRWHNADTMAGMYDIPGIEYDKNGNIIRLLRRGVDAAEMDSLTYQYWGEKVAWFPQLRELVPDGQIGPLNNWVINPGGQTSWQALSDSNDNTYVTCGTEDQPFENTELVLEMSSPEDSIDVTRNLVVFVRFRGDAGGTESSSTLHVKLFEGETWKGSMSWFPRSQTWLDSSIQIPASSISNWSNIRVELSADVEVPVPHPGRIAYVNVADIRVQIPVCHPSLVGETNRLMRVADAVPAGDYPSDIDAQPGNNYCYDMRGNMVKDSAANMMLIYDYRNLPTRITSSGVVTRYRYDAAGKRTYKAVANGDTLYYIYDAAGRNLAVLNANGSIRMLNIHGADHLGYMAVTYEQGGVEEEENHDNPGGEGEGEEEEQQGEPAEPTEEGILAGEGILDSEGTEVPEPDSTSTEVLVTGPGGRIDKRFYYLKDHLGSVRATVQAGHLMLWDDFEDGFKWLHIEGSGFAVEDGRLLNGEENTQMIIDLAPRVLSDGIVTADVRFTEHVEDLENPEHEPSVALLVRYRNPQGYYVIGVSNTSLAIYRRTSSAFVQETYATLPEEAEYNVTHKLQVTVEGNRILVFWNQQYVLHWDDPNPWLTGKVGFRHIEGCNAVEWDNVKVTTGAPGKIVAYDDYDPWGMVLEGRSGNVGNADARFKFLTKEHDTESGFDWLSARGYDARIGRFVTVDPLADQGVLRSWSAYHYSFNNPMRFSDRTGMTPGEDDDNVITQTWNAVKSVFAGGKTSEPLPGSNSPLSSEGQAAVQGINNTMEAGKENVQAGLQATAEFAEDYAGATQAVGVAAGLVAVAFPPTAPVLGPVAGGLLGVSTGADVLAAGARIVDAAMFSGSTEQAVSQSLQVGVDVVSNKVTRGALGTVMRQTGFQPAFRSATTGRFMSNAQGYATRAVADLTGVAITNIVTRSALQSK